jgi:hypothetical protein
MKSSITVIVNVKHKEPDDKSSRVDMPTIQENNYSRFIPLVGTHRDHSEVTSRQDVVNARLPALAPLLVYGVGGNHLVEDTADHGCE